MFLKNKKLLAFLWLLFVTVLLCLPGNALPDTGGNWFDRIHGDKWVHIFLFFVLVFLGCRAVPLRSSRFTYIMITALGILYGILMEFVQLWLVRGRAFEIYDILADAAGCCIGWLVFITLEKRV